MHGPLERFECTKIERLETDADHLVERCAAGVNGRAGSEVADDDLALGMPPGDTAADVERQRRLRPFDPPCGAARSEHGLDPARKLPCAGTSSIAGASSKHERDDINSVRDGVMVSDFLVSPISEIYRIIQQMNHLVARIGR